MHIVDSTLYSQDLSVLEYIFQLRSQINEYLSAVQMNKTWHFSKLPMLCFIRIFTELVISLPYLLLFTYVWNQHTPPPPSLGICWGHALYSAGGGGGGELCFIYGMFLYCKSPFPQHLSSILILKGWKENKLLVLSHEVEANSRREPETNYISLLKNLMNFVLSFYSDCLLFPY